MSAITYVISKLRICGDVLFCRFKISFKTCLLSLESCWPETRLGLQLNVVFVKNGWESQFADDVLPSDGCRHRGGGCEKDVQLNSHATDPMSFAVVRHCELIRSE